MISIHMGSKPMINIGGNNMSEIVKELIIDGKRFTVTFDADAAKTYAKEYHGLTVDEIENHGLNKGLYGEEKPPTPEELNQCVKEMLADIDAIENNPDTLEEIVRGVGKKKDGFFRKGAVNIYKWYDATSYLSEEEYGYRTLTIRAKAVDAQNVTIRLEQDVQKW